MGLRLQSQVRHGLKEHDVIPVMAFLGLYTGDTQGLRRDEGSLGIYRGHTGALQGRRDVEASMPY